MWNDIREIGLNLDTPVMVRQDNGIKSFACYHATKYTRGIVPLAHKNDSFQWDGQSFLMKVTHWREVEPKDLEEVAVENPATNAGSNGQ